MLIITGDDCGLVKFLYPNEQKSLGKIDKKKAISCMSLDKKKLLVCRENGLVELIDTENIQVIYTKQLYEEKTTFIGCYLIGGVIVTCTSTGLVEYIHWSGDTLDLPETSIDLGQDRLCKMRVHPSKPHVFATGGEEKELCLWDVKNLSEKVEPFWKAKNVPNDYLDMRVKVWVTDIQFVNDTQVLISTNYCHVRLYDTSGQRRRPLFTHTVGEYPIKSICTYQDEYLLSDTVGKVVAISKETGKLTGAFKGIAGAVRQVSVVQDHVITVGLDRYLRVYEAKDKRNIIKKVFLKNRLTCFVVDETVVEEVDEWQDIPQVIEEEPAKKKHKVIN